MQTANYTVNSGGGIALWRGIPAQITISGIEDVSGNWLFLVDNDNADGVILSGTVAADGENLVVTLDEMNTVELAAVIQGRDTIQCRATLTDGTSRVFFVPVTVINRAMDVQPPPTPVSEYYTKAQIDAMIAAIPTGTDDYNELDNKPAINSVTLAGNKSAADLGLATPGDIPPAQVQADWTESDTTSKAYIQNKPTIPAAQVQADWNEADTASKAYIKNKPVIPAVPVQSVNGKTGAVVLDADDVGALPASGQAITASGAAITPAHDAVYRHTLAANDEITIDTAGLTATAQVTFEVQLVQPATAVAFTLPAGVLWADGDAFAAGNAAPDLSAANTLYCLVFRWDGANLLGNLAYSKAVTA